MSNRTQVVFINSKQRVSGSSYDFHINLNDGLLKAGKDEYMRITLAEATINRSWYSIQEGDNSFIIRDNTTDITITLPTAYYTAIDIRSTLQGLMPSWLITYDRRTNKFTFTRPTDNKTYYKFVFSNTLNEMLGFSEDEEPTFTVATPTITSSNPVRVNAENAVFIHTDLPRGKMSSLDNHSLTRRNFKESTIFASIPIQCAPFDNIVYSMNSSIYSYSVVAQDINNIRVWITDENERVLKLPFDFSFVLLVVEHIPKSKQDSVKDIKDLLSLMVLSNENILSQ
jgi:hypothetical protein